jgi:hypothetical protein
LLTLLRILVRAITSFYCVHGYSLALQAVLVTQDWPTPEQHALWVATQVAIHLTGLWDAYPGRRLVWLGFVLGALGSFVALWLRSFGLLEVKLGFVSAFGGEINGRSRLLALAQYDVIATTRIAVKAYFYPNRFVTIPEAELWTVRSADASTLIRASYASFRSHHRGAAADTSVRVAPTSDCGGAPVPLAELVARVLGSAAAIAGPDARPVLERELGLLCPHRLERCSTVDIAAVLRRQNSSSSTTTTTNSNGCEGVKRRNGRGEGAARAMLLPVFSPVVVDESATLGTALGARTISPESSSFAVAVASCASWPLTFALTVAALNGAVPARAALAVATLTTVLSVWRLRQASTTILGILVGSFDLWFVYWHVALTALTGCTILAADPALAALWGCSQSLLPLVLLYDSLPFPARLVGIAHRFVFFPAYLAFCVACTWLLISARLPDDGGENRGLIGLMGGPTQVCLSSHLTLVPLAVRFVYRAFRHIDDLVSVGTLRKTRRSFRSSHILLAANANVERRKSRFVLKVFLGRPAEREQQHHVHANEARPS